MKQPEGWLYDLDDDIKRNVLVIMRECRSKSDWYLQRAADLAPRGIVVSVGAADFDEFFKGESLAKFLRYLGDGKSPEEATEETRKFCFEMVTNHNCRRPDVTWRRTTSVDISFVQVFADKIDSVVQAKSQDRAA